MLDNRAEINLIHLDLAVQLGLTITILNYRQLLSANKLKFIKITENTSVQIGGFYYNVLFFVMDGAVTQDYMLGRPFKIQALVGYQNEQDRSVTVSFTSTDWKWVAHTTGFLTDNKWIWQRENVFKNEDHSSRQNDEKN